MAKKGNGSARVQFNGKAGSGLTINVSGIPKLDEILREMGLKPKLRNIEDKEGRLAGGKKRVKTAVKRVKKGVKKAIKNRKK